MLLKYGGTSGERVFISLNPDETELTDVPSDLKGVDRVQYKSFSSLQDELERLISQVLPPPKDEEAENFLSTLQDKVFAVVSKTPNIGIAAISKAIGVNMELAKIAVRNELGVRLDSSGYKKGTKYFVKV